MAAANACRHKSYYGNERRQQTTLIKHACLHVCMSGVHTRHRYCCGNLNINVATEVNRVTPTCIMPARYQSHTLRQAVSSDVTATVHLSSMKRNTYVARFLRLGRIYIQAVLHNERVHYACCARSGTNACADDARNRKQLMTVCSDMTNIM